ncbi:MAG: SUMF1/EgtB/PvdO family nonheme iron enzyme, partial [Myxococcota bacterium]
PQDKPEALHGKALLASEGMAFVDVDYCTKVQETCVRKGEHDRTNHPSICAEFSSERPCIGDQRRMRFCMDRYEYPNRKGAHPPVMVDAWDAAVLCHQQGKRLCWGEEWTAACEGSAQQPFPYGGYARDPTKCQVDQPWIQPDPPAMVSSDPKAQDFEMRRLDQSAPSGSMEGCRSEHGIYDLTGNFDEWVALTRNTSRKRWAGHKGGHWLPVRNACRPTGTGHPEAFVFYAVSFRCCSDPNPEAVEPLPDDAAPLWSPPPSRTMVTSKPAIRGPVTKFIWSPEYDKFKPYAEENDARVRVLRKERAIKLEAEERKRRQWEENLKATQP